MGHLSADEVMRLVPLAIDIGVQRVILTHPHYPAIKLSDDRQQELSLHEAVFIEHCFAIHTQDGVALNASADAIRKTWPEKVLLSTDFGQVNSDPFPDGSVRYAMELWSKLEGMISENDFLAMFSTNGRRALGLLK